MSKTRLRYTCLRTDSPFITFPHYQADVEHITFDIFLCGNVFVHARTPRPGGRRFACEKGSVSTTVVRAHLLQRGSREVRWGKVHEGRLQVIFIHVCMRMHWPSLPLCLVLRRRYVRAESIVSTIDSESTRGIGYPAFNPRHRRVLYPIHTGAGGIHAAVQNRARSAPTRGL